MNYMREDALMGSHHQSGKPISTWRRQCQDLISSMLVSFFLNLRSLKSDEFWCSCQSTFFAYRAGPVNDGFGGQ